MTDRSRFEKELSFENTPLQNLKNILSSAEASITQQEAVLQADEWLKALGQERPCVAKDDIRKAIAYLHSVQGKYVSAAAIGRIASELCAPEDDSILSSRNSIINIYINSIRQIISNSTLQ